MFGLIRKKKALRNIEKLFRDSFEEGFDLTESALDHTFTIEDNFKMTYLVRSKCFWNISHLMDYIEKAMED